MPATTEAIGQPIRRDTRALKWLRRQAPAWLGAGSAGLALSEAVIIIVQAGLIAVIAHRIFILGQPVAAVDTLLGLLLGVFMLRALADGLRGILAAGASARVRLELRDRLVRRLSHAPPDPSRETGRLAAACIEQIDALDGYYARYLPQLVAAGLIPAVILAAVFSLDWIAGLALLLTGPLIPVFMALIGFGAERLSREHHAAMARLGGWFLDRLRGAETLRLFRAEGDEIRRVGDMTDRLRQRAMAVLRVAFLSSAVLEFLSAVAIATLAIYIGLGLMGMLEFGPAPRLTLFNGLFILLLAPEYFQPIRALSQGWHDRADARGALAELQPLLDLPPARMPPARPADLPAAEGMAVALRDIGFAHANRRALFDNLNLDITVGERIVLTGPSGGGKSTLLQLLAGSLAPQSGRIHFNGVDLALISDDNLAARVAWLDQRPVLFAGSIVDNLRAAWPQADATTVTRAAERAGVNEFARCLPAGLDTRVGEDGFGLSGGQIQRIALARALIRPKPLLLLDEPTASLDAAGETRILEALEAWLVERRATVICASHRPALLPWADRILEIRNGQLTQIPR